MRDISLSNFGLIAAYLLPGSITVWGVSLFSPTVRSWLTASPAGPTIGGFLYVTLASLGAGLLVSTARWLFLDTLHRRTGLRQPGWDFSQLQAHLDAFQLLVESHYRYYQFYANSSIALLFSYLAWRLATAPQRTLPYDLVFLAAEGLLFLGSRDALRKYYERAHILLR